MMMMLYERYFGVEETVECVLLSAPGLYEGELIRAGITVETLPQYEEELGSVVVELFQVSGVRPLLEPRLAMGVESEQLPEDWQCNVTQGFCVIHEGVSILVFTGTDTSWADLHLLDRVKKAQDEGYTALAAFQPEGW
jgi:hypothetical protein